MRFHYRGYKIGGRNVGKMEIIILKGCHREEAGKRGRGNKYEMWVEREKRKTVEGMDVVSWQRESSRRIGHLDLESVAEERASWKKGRFSPGILIFVMFWSTRNTW